jgi:nitrite reductase (NO-forming)
MDNLDHTNEEAVEGHEHDKMLSRRNLLLGSAGLTICTVAALGAGKALAEEMQMDMAVPATTGSDRLYDINTFEGVNDIARDPTDLPPPITRREPATVRVDLETVEVEARLDDNTTYQFWTFNGRVPGPFVRVRVGDTVEVHLKNNENSVMMHNVDFHAATGPGGGAGATSANPGEEKMVTFKALVPGLFIYHCATPPVAMHISSGMYGLILVEPENGLPPVDREFYVVQGEIYTEEDFGTKGMLTASYDKLIAETPTYFFFNGHGQMTKP